MGFWVLLEWSSSCSCSCSCSCSVRLSTSQAMAFAFTHKFLGFSSFPFDQKPNPALLRNHLHRIVCCTHTNSSRYGSAPPFFCQEPAPLNKDCCRSSHVVLDMEVPMSSPTESWSEMLTELQRSFLETQWTLAQGQQRRVSPSGRHSARHRRLNARKQKKREIENENVSLRAVLRVTRIEQGKNETAAVHSTQKTQRKSRKHSVRSDASVARNGKHSWIDSSLSSVTTLGLKSTRLLTKEEEIILSQKMRTGQNLKAARAKLVQVLGRDPSDSLWASSVNMTFPQVQAKILEADRAKDQMFVSNLRLVFSLANKYTGNGLSFSDLVQEGAVGLIRGLEKFDHTKGFRLSTYVHWWVWQGMTRALSEHSRTVRLPAHIHSRLSAINRAAETLTMERKPISIKSLSHAVKISEESVTIALKASKKMVSFDKAKKWGPFKSEGDSLHNYVADPSPESDPWFTVEKRFMREDVDDLLMKILNEREREIVRLHYGLDGTDGKPVSLNKIGHRYGMSRERIRQIEDYAMRKLIAVSQRIDFYPYINC